MNKVTIIAPHADDEIIGCWELLTLGLVESVLFISEQAMEEAIPSSEYFGFNIGMADGTFNYGKTFLFPDPTYELHPEHRRLGMLGEEVLRAEGKVVFYSTNMSAPYIHEVTAPLNKLSALNNLYPKKASLWAYDHKYYLFEGYTKWIMKWDD